MSIAKCRFCRQEFEPRSNRGKKQIYCSTECQNRLDNERRMRGAVLYEACMNWRYNRTGSALNEAQMRDVVMNMLRTWHDQDIANKRANYKPPPSWATTVSNYALTIKG